MSATSSNALGKPFDEGTTGGGEAKKGDAAVKHVVVLMLENRSFDNALGYLDSHHPFDGLHPTPSSSSQATTTQTTDLAQERESKAAEDGRSSSGSEAKEEVKMNRAYFNTTSGGDEAVWPEPKAQFYTPVDPPHSHKEIMEQMFGEGRVPSFPQDASSTPPKVHNRVTYYLLFIYNLSI
jgi:phospholipase C